MANKSSGLCDIGRFYSEKTIAYGFPELLLRNYYSGTGFNSTPYNQKEQNSLDTNIKILYSTVIRKSPNYGKEVMIGTPGASEEMSMLLKQHQKSKNPNFVYIRTPNKIISDIQSFRETILEENTGSNGDFLTISNEIVKKCLSGAHAANHILKANLIQKGVSFYDDSPSLDYMADYLAGLKKAGYRVKVIHVVLPNDTDGEKVAALVNDVYMTYADEIEFYYHDKAHKINVPKLAATWIRSENIDPYKVGKLKKESFYYKILQDCHNQYCQELGKKYSWRKAIEAVSVLDEAVKA